jgi:hypothetical protein
MPATEFQINEVFDIPTRGGVIVVGHARPGELIGIPHLCDEGTRPPITILGVDHPTPRTTGTGETILVVDQAAAEYAEIGRIWTTITA